MEATTQFERSKNSLEIRSNSSSPNVTVYRPERERFSERPGEFKVRPGYINASSFHIKTEQDAVDFKSAMSEALRELDEYNSVVPGWVRIENPWEEVEYLKRRIEYLESERGAKEILARFKSAKKAVEVSQ